MPNKILELKFIYIIIRRTVNTSSSVFYCKYSAIFTEPELSNCFSIIFKRECEKLEGNLAKHEKQMSLSLAIVPRNPIITAKIILNMYMLKIATSGSSLTLVWWHRRWIMKLTIRV